MWLKPRRSCCFLVPLTQDSESLGRGRTRGDPRWLTTWSAGGGQAEAPADGVAPPPPGARRAPPRPGSTVPRAAAPTRGRAPSRPAPGASPPSAPRANPAPGPQSPGSPTTAPRQGPPCAPPRPRGPPWRRAGRRGRTLTWPPAVRASARRARGAGPGRGLSEPTKGRPAAATPPADWLSAGAGPLVQTGGGA